MTILNPKVASLLLGFFLHDTIEKIMAWYNLNSTDDIVKEFCQERVIDRCIFCGQHEEIKTTMTIYFSEFETNTGPICKRCYHANAKKAVMK